MAAAARCRGRQGEPSLRHFERLMMASVNHASMMSLRSRTWPAFGAIMSSQQSDVYKWGGPRRSGEGRNGADFLFDDLLLPARICRQVEDKVGSIGLSDVCIDGLVCAGLDCREGLRRPVFIGVLVAEKPALDSRHVETMSLPALRRQSGLRRHSARARRLLRSQSVMRPVGRQVSAKCPIARSMAEYKAQIAARGHF